MAKLVTIQLFVFHSSTFTSPHSKIISQTTLYPCLHFSPNRYSQYVVHDSSGCHPQMERHMPVNAFPKTLYSTK